MNMIDAHARPVEAGPATGAVGGREDSKVLPVFFSFSFSLCASAFGEVMCLCGEAAEGFLTGLRDSCFGGDFWTDQVRNLLSFVGFKRLGWMGEEEGCRWEMKISYEVFRTKYTCNEVGKSSWMAFR